MCVSGLDQSMHGRVRKVRTTGKPHTHHARTLAGYQIFTSPPTIFYNGPAPSTLVLLSINIETPSETAVPIRMVQLMLVLPQLLFSYVDSIP